MTDHETAVLKTLAYADIFHHALRQDQVVTFCIEQTLSHGYDLSKVTSSKITSRNNCYALAGRENLISLKDQQEATAEEKVRYAQQWRWVFNLVPWIKLVAISGSIAGGTPKPEDDIDLLIITDPRRLWLSRLIVTILLNIAGKRRKPSDNPNKVNNKFCLNMWLSLESLEENHHDIYVANELARIIPVLNRQQTYERYMQSNKWMSTYLPNFYNKISKVHTPSLKKSSVFHPLSLLDKAAEKIQRKIMRQPTIETIQDSRLAFHPHDYRTEILTKYKQKLKELEIKY